MSSSRKDQTNLKDNNEHLRRKCGMHVLSLSSSPPPPPPPVEGLDYEGGDYTAMFTPGSRTATVVIATIPDSMLEPNETFEALLMTTSEADDKGVEVGTPEMATITILDNTSM